MISKRKLKKKKRTAALAQWVRALAPGLGVRIQAATDL